ncbi:LysR family transcriptional regulator [Parasutterella excrementihominis]|uniref:LysR family transcriptional regulator n=1 Tax=Parasutterella excrementihominis TaxID=487175 RepID=UPI003077A075
MSSCLDHIENWKVIQKFAQTKSITRTALELDLEISKVSRIVSQVEKELERRIFDRSERPIKLTPFGEELMSKLAPCLQEWDAFYRFVDPQESVFSNIRLSTPIGIGRFYVNNQLDEYRKYHPNVSVELFVDCGIDDVLTNKVDVAFIPCCPEDKRLAVYPCMDAFTMPLASKEYVAKHGFPHRPEDLKNHIGILKIGSDFPITSRLVRRGESRVIMWKQSIRQIDMLNIKDALLKGHGISLDVPLGMVLDEIQRGELVQVLDNWHRPRWQYSVVTRKEVPEVSIIGKFAEWYASVATREIDERRERGFRLLGLDPSLL